MYPSIEVQTSSMTEPQTFQISSSDLWEAEELYDRAKIKPGTMGIRLICAFIHVTGNNPHTLKEVKAWAKENQVWAQDAEMPDPTQPGQSEDS
jgi:hypothetical protein